MSILKRIWKGTKARVMGEPVMTLAIVQAFLNMAVGFGLGMSGEQVALVSTFAAAILGWLARSKVTPGVDA